MFRRPSFALPITAAFLFFGLATSVYAAPPTTPPAAPVQVMNIPLPVTVTDTTIGVEGEVTVEGAVTIDNTSPIPVAVENAEQQYTVQDDCNLNDPPYCEVILTTPTNTRFVIEYVNSTLWTSASASFYLNFSCEFNGSVRDYYMPLTQNPSFTGYVWVASEQVTIYCDSDITLNTGRTGVSLATAGSAYFTLSGRLIPNPD